MSGVCRNVIWKRGYTMAIRKMTVTEGQKPTEEQKKRIREAMKRPIVYDDDAPELTDEQYRAFAVVAEKQRRERETM